MPRLQSAGYTHKLPLQAFLLICAQNRRIMANVRRAVNDSTRNSENTSQRFLQYWSLARTAVTAFPFPIFPDVSVMEIIWQRRSEWQKKPQASMYMEWSVTATKYPPPSLNLPRENTDGNVVIPVTIHPDLYRAKRDNERVKTNITLPAWLKRIAEEQKVNYSRLLETALMDYLQLPKQSGR